MIEAEQANNVYYFQTNLRKLILKHIKEHPSHPSLPEYRDLILEALDDVIDHFIIEKRPVGRPRKQVVQEDGISTD